MISVRQLKAARALLGWSQDEMASKSGLSRTTLGRLEMADEQLGGYATTRDKIVRTCEAAGITFLSEDDGSEGVKISGSE
ncbi:XRE family transcriptional regulator [Lichenibacterium minor]|uniref:XRE family transcriptional regulator n=1 Tax=Lichenibacterium minor TaxID=2316528 RepID=A0A4V1RVB3_9HYPH|nr:helix-turn-helix transcriptional regulator [Lichenibacterium minor]RYC34054.1 XRE family transcriptional regulator [Lichenibacterium minor]